MTARDAETWLPAGCERAEDLYSRARREVSLICSAHGWSLLAGIVTAATTPDEWRYVGRALVAEEAPDARAACDAAMMLARGDAGGAATVLSVMRGLSLRAWASR